jgi:methionyl aminopeptidase
MPDYYVTGRPKDSNQTFIATDAEDIKKVRAAGRLARKILDFAMSTAKPGMTTEQLDVLCHNEIIKHNAYPSPINYCGFPKAVCTSVNDCVVHGIPDDRVLEDGDVLSVDVSLFKVIVVFHHFKLGGSFTFVKCRMAFMAIIVAQ